MTTGHLKHGGHALAPSRIGGDMETARMPKVVIGDVGEPLAKGLAAHFAKLGWRVRHAPDDARAAAVQCKAHGVILPAESETESGFLSCAKLTAGRSKVRVVLVGPADQRQAKFARFAGAVGYATPDMAVGKVAEHVTGALAPRLN